jgi:hypothetical protein
MGAFKQAMLANYMNMRNIDVAFLQEGESTYVNPLSETYGGSTNVILLDVDSSDRALKIVSRLNPGDSPVFAPVGGVNRAGYYNVVVPGALAVALLGDGVAVDYLANPAIRDWILTPANRERVDKKKIVFARRGAIEGAGDKNFKRQLNETIMEPVTRRMNMMGQRRPKAAQVGGVTIYHWHAPLGGAATLSGVGYTAYSAIANEGSGGQLAVAGNILFSKFLGITAAFPANTILLGDLNISAAAVREIYKTANFITSHDGLCHAIADPSMPLTPEVTTLDQFALGVSDHAPIVFTY